MRLKLGNDDVFNCPEGNHRGILERVAEPKKPVNKPCKEQVRLMYRITLDNGNEHLVARTFCADLNYGSELYHFLESWLDGKFDVYLDDNGEIDLDGLIGKPADVVIKHIETQRHEKPYVHIARIFPAGRLIDR